MKKKCANNILTTFITLIFLSAMLIYGTGCRKLVKIGPPTNELSSGNVFRDSTNATSSITGLYAVMYNFNYSKSTPFQDYLTTLPALSADELYYFPNSTLNQYLNNRIPVTDNANYDLWTDPYSFIYQANSIIAGLASSTTLTPSLKNQLTGEALTIRSMCYFYLVNYFDNVPLILNTDVIANSQLPRTEKALIYQQIIKDLTDAKPLLSRDYSYSGNNKTRINYFAATALLARVYLYAEEWAKAEIEASAVIDETGLYSLSPLQDVFLANSSDAIFQFYTDRLGFPAIAQYFLPSNDTQAPNYVITNNLWSAFENGDQRKNEWIDSLMYNGVFYKYPRKYRTNNQSAGQAEYDMVLRLSEQFLIRAEARAMLNNLDGAREDLDVIRNRAELSGTSAVSMEDILSDIMHERQVEFCFEYGHRWLDLKRTKTIDEVLNTAKPGRWESAAALFPIPQDARNTNRNLEQNPGY